MFNPQEYGKPQSTSIKKILIFEDRRWHAIIHKPTIPVLLRKIILYYLTWVAISLKYLYVMQTSQKLKTNNQYQENQADFWRIGMSKEHLTAKFLIVDIINLGQYIIWFYFPRVSYWADVQRY